MEKYNHNKNVLFHPNKLCEPFDYLRKNAIDGYSDYKELTEANTIARKNALTKVKRLELEKTAGYVTISTLTIIVTLVIGLVIFIAVGTVLGG